MFHLFNRISMTFGQLYAYAYPNAIASEMSIVVLWLQSFRIQPKWTTIQSSGQIKTTINTISRFKCWIIELSVSNGHVTSKEFHFVWSVLRASILLPEWNPKSYIVRWTSVDVMRCDAMRTTKYKLISECELMSKKAANCDMHLNCVLSPGCLLLLENNTNANGKACS